MRQAQPVGPDQSVIPSLSWFIAGVIMAFAANICPRRRSRPRPPSAVRREERHPTRSGCATDARIRDSSAVHLSDCRELQDQIYRLRRHGPPVAQWFTTRAATTTSTPWRPPWRICASNSQIFKPMTTRSVTSRWQWSRTLSGVIDGLAAQNRLRTHFPELSADGRPSPASILQPERRPLMVPVRATGVDAVTVLVFLATLARTRRISGERLLRLWRRRRLPLLGIDVRPQERTPTPRTGESVSGREAERGHEGGAGDARRRRHISKDERLAAERCGGKCGYGDQRPQNPDSECWCLTTGQH